MTQRIDIAGQDRTADTVADIAKLIAKHPPPESWLRAYEKRTASALKTCDSEKTYMDTLVQFLRDKTHLVTDDFPIASRDAAVSRAMVRVKKALWKLLRYQHDHMAGQQNHINALLTSALEFERERNNMLEQRILALESKQEKQN
jgi:hypothetical protein